MKKMRFLTVCLLSLVLAFSIGPAMAAYQETLYMDAQMEIGNLVQLYNGAVLTAFSIENTDPGPYPNNRVAGYFDNGAFVTIGLGNLSAHDMLRVEYQVGFLGAWDNGRFMCWGPNGLMHLDTTFTNNPNGTQNYPTAGSPGGSGSFDSMILFGDMQTYIYNMSHTFAHNINTSTTYFYAPGCPSGAYWYLDNIKVYGLTEVIVPEPSSIMALFSGLLGLGIAGLRRK